MKGKDLQSHYIPNTALPYVTNDSVTSKAMMFEDGSTNLMTSIKGYAERRNGFSRYVSDATFTFSGTLSRMYTWRRWTGAAFTNSGKYFVMYNDLGASASRVYKQQVGTDVYPVLVHTDSTSANPFDFTVSNNHLFFGNGVDMKKYDGSTVTNWGIAGPSAAVTFTSAAGSLSPVIGYQWVIAWENSGTGHISSPAPVSTTTTGTSRQYTISGNTTTDTQVDRVRIFRTVDGGSIYFEHPSSPISYVTWTASGFVDNTADSALTSSVAPLPNQNNRPTASKDPVWFANRIWTHIDDTLYYSDFEELVRGVEEESFASTNLRFFGREIFGKKVAGQYLLIFTADVIYRIYGDSLATFRMDKLSDDRGALNPACICSFTATLSAGQSIGMVAWLDSSNTVWITDGSAMTEISIPIRPDIASIVHAQAALTYHTTGNAQWLVLMNGGGNELLVYDLDRGQWMPPWPLDTLRAIYSGQTSPGTHQLFLGRNNTPLVQDAGYQDAGSNYTGNAYFGLFDLVPPDQPSMYGVLNHIALETNSVQATTVKYLTDEDPAGATYQTASTAIDPPNRAQGTNLVEKWYPVLSDPNNKGARRVAMQVNWAAANSSFKLYGVALGYEPKA